MSVRSIHHAHHHILRMGEMKRVIWSHFLSTFGMAMVTIFVPIFLLRSGYSFSDVTLYLAELSLFSLPLQYFASKLIGRLRANHAMAIGLAWKGWVDLSGFLPPADALHGLAIGAVGTMTLAIMSRATLGHTGRPLHAPPPVVAAYLLVGAAAIARLAAPVAPAGPGASVVSH